MRYIITLFMMILALGSSAQVIDRAEYFINTDPGFGQAIAWDAFTSATQIDDLMQDITLNLPQGAHKIGVRVGSADGKWSHTSQFQVQMLDDTPAGDITDIEYYIDTDPGIGVATVWPASFVDAPSIDDLLTVLPVTGLSIGQHTAGLRAKDSHGRWSHVELFKFRVLADTTATDLAVVEYFWQRDTGVLLNDPDFDQASQLTTDIQTTVISDYGYVANLPADAMVGENLTLYMRVKDEEGQWSLTQRVDEVEVFPLGGNTIIDTLACAGYQAPDGMVIEADTSYQTVSFDGSAYFIVDLTVEIVEVDPSFSFNDGTLSAVAVNDSYQWIDCDASSFPIDGATNSTYVVPFESNYALMVQNDGCTATSECQLVMVSSLEDLQAGQTFFAFYPNPASDELIIELSSVGVFKAIEILDMQGRVILSETLSQLRQSFSLSDFSSGEYMLRIRDGERVDSSRLQIIR